MVVKRCLAHSPNNSTRFWVDDLISSRFLRFLLECTCVLAYLTHENVHLIVRNVINDVHRHDGAQKLMIYSLNV